MYLVESFETESFVQETYLSFMTCKFIDICEFICELIYVNSYVISFISTFDFFFKSVPFCPEFC